MKATHEFKGSDTYIPSDELSAMVNLALARERPLLLTGESGLGKTMLGYALGQKFDWPVYRGQMLSTMRGQEVCYTFDNILRLSDAQLAGSNISTDGRCVSNPMDYVRFGALGKGFKSKKRAVVILDEMDKTTTDVHDDLLRVLETYEFEITEAGSCVKAEVKPFILLTSNQKRELSDALLGRVYAHNIEFPSEGELSAIINRHYPSASAQQTSHAINVLMELRAMGLEKPPATRELLDWFGAMQSQGKKFPDSAYIDKIPYLGVLLKKTRDIARLAAGPGSLRRTRDQRR